jgi:acyl-CoA reductase-like NAD-dependent aldehyde dehydrogenase
MSAVAPEPAGVPRARMMLQRAHWAATAFAGYDPQRTWRIVEATAEAAYQNAERYAEWAVRETGMGVVEHKRIKNEACSRGVVEWYAEHDYVSARIDADARIVELPRPASCSR